MCEKMAVRKHSERYIFSECKKAKRVQFFMTALVFKTFVAVLHYYHRFFFIDSGKRPANPFGKMRVLCYTVGGQPASRRKAAGRKGCPLGGRPYGNENQ